MGRWTDTQKGRRGIYKRTCVNLNAKRKQKKYENVTQIGTNALAKAEWIGEGEKKEKSRTKSNNGRERGSLRKSVCRPAVGVMLCHLSWRHCQYKGKNLPVSSRKRAKTEGERETKENERVRDARKRG